VLRLVSADYLRWGEGEHSLRELRAAVMYGGRNPE